MSFLLFLGIGLFGQSSALACTSNMPNYDSCVRRQQEHQQRMNDYHYHHQQQQQNQSSSNYYNRGYSTQDDYLGFAWTKDGKPYFRRASYLTHGGFLQSHFDENDAITLAECNKSSRRAPCVRGLSVTNACIAIAKANDGFITSASGNTCKDAKQNVIAHCKAESSSPNSCKVSKSKHASIAWW